MLRSGAGLSPALAYTKALWLLSNARGSEALKLLEDRTAQKDAKPCGGLYMPATSNSPKIPEPRHAGWPLQWSSPKTPTCSGQP